MAYNQVSVSNPAAASYADGSTVTAFAGKQGETLASEIHGKWYTAAYRGHAFWASTAAAGTTIPVTTTTAATFVIYNPIGSGVNIELISYEVGMAAVTTTVAATICLGFSGSLTVAPTGLTALTSLPCLNGSNAAAVGRVYSAATIVATAAPFFPMVNLPSTAMTGTWGHYEFDGRVCLSPGTLAHTVATTVQTQAMIQGIVWAEWPV